MRAVPKNRLNRFEDVSKLAKRDKLVAVIKIMQSVVKQKACSRKGLAIKEKAINAFWNLLFKLTKCKQKIVEQKQNKISEIILFNGPVKKILSVLNRSRFKLKQRSDRSFVPNGLIFEYPSTLLSKSVK